MAAKILTKPIAVRLAINFIGFPSPEKNKR
jgi:hypothetical protein